MRFPLIRPILAAWLISAVLPAAAVETDICFDYSCKRQQTAVFSEPELAELRNLLATGADAEQERTLIGEAIGRMYAIAARQTPIWRDRGRNFMDERDLAGAMDCIDHSTNTDRFLRLLADAGAMKFHRPGERRVRFRFLLLGEHWTAILVENQGDASYAVDAWFFDPGLAAAVVPFERWRAGYDPES